MEGHATMANTLLTPSVIARMALATLYNQTVMAQLVHRDYSQEFVSKIGTTVTIRKPATFTAQEYVRASGITVQNATETSVPVVLNHLADVSFAVTSEDLTLKVESFQEQFVAPAMEAIAQKIDQDILAFRDDIVQEVGTNGSTTTGVSGRNVWDWTNPRVTIDADRVLNSRAVPPSDRAVVVDPNTKAKWLGDDLLNRADASGSTQALRDASLGGKVFGFNPFMSQNVQDGVNVAFHRTAVALVTRPLVLPMGAANAAVENYKGFGLRVVIDYNLDQKMDTVSIDTCYGVKTLAAERAVLITPTAS